LLDIELKEKDTRNVTTFVKLLETDYYY